MTQPLPEGEKVKDGVRRVFTSVEVARQVDQVREWLITGYRPSEIRQLCAEHWGVRTRAAESRMQEARREVLRDIAAIDRQEITAQMVESASDILKLARESRQLSNAIGALRLQAELLGINGRKSN
jgi:hypothetical protein